MSGWEGAELMGTAELKQQREASAGKGRPGRDHGLGGLPGEADRPRPMGRSVTVSWKLVVPGLPGAFIFTGILSRGFYKPRRQSL